MRRIFLLAVLGIWGCRPPDVITVQKSVPSAAPSLVSAPAPAPVSASTPDTKCHLTTEIAELNTYFGVLPADVSADDAYNAALQFIVIGGDAVESQDPVAHTIITRRVDGQTWVSTCPINRYFMYAYHVAIFGRQMVVDMKCWSSLGTEGGLTNGVMLPRDRGELRACNVPRYVSKGDAQLPWMLFDGTIQLLKLQRMTQPITPPPPTAAELRSARWWCSFLGSEEAGFCHRRRDRCEEERRTMHESGTELTECRPKPRAACFEQRWVRLGGTMQSCHPTSTACHSQFEYVKTKRSEDARPVDECHFVD